MMLINLSQFPESLCTVRERYYKGIQDDSSLFVKLSGNWETLVGDQDTFVHILEYENYSGYDKAIQLVKASDSVVGPYILCLVIEYRISATEPEEAGSGILFLVLIVFYSTAMPIAPCCRSLLLARTNYVKNSHSSPHLPRTPKAASLSCEPTN